MSAQIISFPRQQAIIEKLMAAQDELSSVAEQKEDSVAAADLFGVIERLQEIILKIQSPL
jgi:hypothetical protein